MLVNKIGLLEIIIRVTPHFTALNQTSILSRPASGISRRLGRWPAWRIWIVRSTRRIWIIWPARRSRIIWAIGGWRVVRISRGRRVVRPTWWCWIIRAVWTGGIRILRGRTFSILWTPRLGWCIAWRIRPVGIVWRIVRAIRIVWRRITWLLRILNTGRAEFRCTRALSRRKRAHRYQCS